MTHMSNEKAPVFSDGFAVPITGLLAFLFAIMAGMTVTPALSGSLTDIAIPVSFGLASLFCFRLRQQAIASQTEN